MKDRPSLKILYEDNHLFVVHKPAGILTCQDHTGDLSLLEMAKDWIKIHHQKPGKVFLAQVHRLDRRTEGVVVFCKTSKGASRISDQFRKKKIQKVYHAVVEGILPSKRGKIEKYLKKSGRGKNLRTLVFSEPVSGAKKSELSYKVLKTAQNKSLLRIHPHTGRFHQIRAMVANLGHPILADVKYGAHPYPLQGAIALQATAITLVHPTKQDLRTFGIPLPSLWPL